MSSVHTFRAGDSPRLKSSFPSCSLGEPHFGVEGLLLTGRSTTGNARYGKSERQQFHTAYA